MRERLKRRHMRAALQTTLRMILRTTRTAGPGFESRRNDVGVPLPVLGGAWIHAAQGRRRWP